MADQSHLDILEQGVRAWNSWREQNPSIAPDLTVTPLNGANLSGANLTRAHLSNADLSGADLTKADLSDADLSVVILTEADLSEADLSRANLTEADLSYANLFGAVLHQANLSRGRFGEADLSEARLTGADLSDAALPSADLTGADLSDANLSYADLRQANFTEANLSGADLSETDLSTAKLIEAVLPDTNLSGANLIEADLSEADLSRANLTRSILVQTNLTGTTLTGCRVYGISAWNLKLEGATQQNLNISDDVESAIMVDNLEVAQFIYLLLNNERIRQVIDTITSKVVVILGRFTKERKVVLDALRNSLRQHDYLPVLFDFEGPTSRDRTETVSTLAHMARFIIADITEAKSIPQELQAIVPDLPSVPVQPLLLTSEREYGMFEHFRRYPWVLDTYYYDNLNEVLASIEDKVISPAETKARELSS
jgi:uncharacterized protein YjbI with pentapeptide repeats